MSTDASCTHLADPDARQELTHYRRAAALLVVLPLLYFVFLSSLFLFEDAQPNPNARPSRYFVLATGNTGLCWTIAVHVRRAKWRPGGYVIASFWALSFGLSLAFAIAYASKVPWWFIPMHFPFCGCAICVIVFLIRGDLARARYAAQRRNPKPAIRNQQNEE